MRKRMTVVLAALVVVVGLAAGCQPNEDEPGWDCHTMGNRICGQQ